MSTTRPTENAKCHAHGRWWQDNWEDEYLEMEYTIQVTFDAPLDSLYLVHVEKKAPHGEDETVVYIPGVGYIIPKRCAVIRVKEA